MDEIARWDEGWRPTYGRWPMPDGPVELWVAVFADDGHFMGAERTQERPAWRWRHGTLAMDYSPVRVVMRHGGRYHTGVLCAVNPAARAYRALFAVSLGEPRKLRAGDDMLISDGVIAIRPDPPALP